MAASEQELVGPALTADYLPTGFVYPAWYMFFNRRKPPFSLSYIPQMLSHYRIRMGLWIIKGPILSEAKFFIKCPDEGIKTFIRQNLTKFWQTSAVKALSSTEWGYSGSEALYEIKNNLIYFAGLKCINQYDTRVISMHGNKVGMVVRNIKKRGKIYIGGPKCFWHVHGRDMNQFYGVSRLVGSFGPWIELVSDGGAEDIRRLFHHKYAYSGDTIYYPPGISQLPDGNEVSNKDLARDIVEKRRSGGVTAMPNTLDESGNRRWEILPGEVNPSAANVMEYIEVLKKECLEGMGIPPEVVAAQGTGAYAGRQVPERAFYSELQELIVWLVTDFNTQIMRPLLESNFGDNFPDYEIIPFNLLKLIQQNEKGNDNPLDGQEDEQTTESGGAEATDTKPQPRTPYNKSKQVRTAQRGRKTKLRKGKNLKQEETRTRSKFPARTR